jgi:hypothetical protein
MQYFTTSLFGGGPLAPVADRLPVGASAGVVKKVGALPTTLFQGRDNALASQANLDGLVTCRGSGGRR